MSDHHSSLYVITTNMPGPGAKALVELRARNLDERGYIIPAIAETALADAADAACEFVELEDTDGCGHGPGTGVDWGRDDAGRPRLGPFLSAQQVGVALGRLYGCLVDPGDLDQVPEPLRTKLRAERADGVITDVSADVFLATWEACMTVAADELANIAVRAGRAA